MTQLEEWSFDCEEQEHGGSIDSNLDAKKSGQRCQRDVVIIAELLDEMDGQFLNQIRAVGDAGDERRTGNRDSINREPRTDRANKQRGHADGDERELPHAGNDCQVVGFAEIQRVGD